ncbi:phage virion morphogenesis protein [Sphingomonas paucimobilis]|uniref:Phage virion morphogenesis protein n=1 Tax=Sphingomonas paucimobilis TaxID=13689 RepID=A0A7T3E661_SPHPI|nr:phage virion morphogenesis protein [Sphingomonas paucimobilis]QPT09868.1 phage virion morphogenesis protein [Sphingomonas paucimobilis]
MIRIMFNIEELTQRLGVAATELGDMTPVHEDIGDYMVRQTKLRFVSGVDPYGTRWRPKKPSTIERYKAQGDGNKTKPLIGPSGRLGKEIYFLASRSETEIGSALEYSGVMQGGAAKGAFGRNARGGPLPWGTIPARPFLGLSDADERSILDIVDEHLAEAIGE